ncbi:MAG: hypothetical protein IJ361_10735 [Spirochaetaceae bacterium]|nr:hypothetical protein [Spirochaetaceae bacterium]
MKNLKKTFLCLIMFTFVFVFMSCGNPLKKAETGWFYYSDGSCSDVYDSSKSVIGVIFSDAYVDDEKDATKYVLKNGWLFLEKSTWTIGSTYRKDTIVGKDINTWYIPSEEEAFSIFCYKNRLNASLQSLRDSNVTGTNTIHGAIWTTDTSILDSNRGIAIDFDSKDGWTGAVKSGSKNLDLCLWPIMKVYVPKK